MCPKEHMSASLLISDLSEVCEYNQLPLSSWCFSSHFSYTRLVFSRFALPNGQHSGLTSGGHEAVLWKKKTWLVFMATETIEAEVQSRCSIYHSCEFFFCHRGRNNNTNLGVIGEVPQPRGPVHRSWPAAPPPPLPQGGLCRFKGTIFGGEQIGSSRG